MDQDAKSAHTPGLWKICNVPGRDALAVYDNQANEYIATVWHSERDPKEGAANARLIAAAPDLLAALKEVVRLSDRQHDAWDAARAAIAKATTGDVNAKGEK